MNNITITVSSDNPFYPFAVYLKEMQDLLDAKDAAVAERELLLDLKNMDIASFQQDLAALGKELESVKKELLLLKRPEWEVKVDSVLDVARYLLQRHIDSGLTLFPYKFGGNPVLNAAGEVTGGTFDCSSYTRYCYNLQGVVLPRVSKDQATKGVEVGRAEVRKGDLLAFDTDGDKVINHVGIALDNEYMIHSNPSGKGVNIVKLDGYWNGKFVTGRRFFS